MKKGQRSATAAVRRQKAFSMRLAGHTFQGIGDTIGISRQGAHGLITRELERLNKQSTEDATILRDLELERLDVMVKAIWPKAEAGNFGAIDRLLRISERRSKLLGLDAATKTEIEIPYDQVRVSLPNNNRGDN